MAKYGAFEYGTSEKYGTAGATETGDVTHVLMIDWDNDGIFDGTNEAGRMTNCVISRGIKHYLSTSGRGFEPMRGGTATLTLDNYDRRYDPRYTSSPLYPNVGPGKQVYLRVINNSDQTNYDILKGVIADIRPMSGPGGDKKVRMIVNDYMQEIWEATLSENASKLLVRLDVAYQTIMNDIGYKGAISGDGDSQPIPCLHIDEMNAGQVLNDLAHAGLGQFFVDRIGTARYYGRNHQSYTSHSIDEDVCLKQILVSQPWDAVYNEVNVIANRPIWKVKRIIYTLPNPEAINVGTTLTLNVHYPPSKDIHIDELEANTKKDGNGTDISSSLTVGILPRFGVSSSTITIDTSTNGYITRLDIEGKTMSFVREDSVFSDTTSIASYGLKKLKINTPFMQDPHYAAVFSEAIKDITKASREAITIEIRQRPSVQYPIDLWHSVAFTAGTLTLDDTYYITGYEHRWNNDTGQDVTTTIWLHKIITNATSITASEVEIENYVPPQLFHPSPTPWLPPVEPPVEGFSSTDGYIFIPVTGAGVGSFDVPKALCPWGARLIDTESSYCGFSFIVPDSMAGSYTFEVLIRPQWNTTTPNCKFYLYVQSIDTDPAGRVIYYFGEQGKYHTVDALSNAEDYGTASIMPVTVTLVADQLINGLFSREGNESIGNVDVFGFIAY